MKCLERCANLPIVARAQRLQRETSDLTDVNPRHEEPNIYLNKAGITRDGTQQCTCGAST